MCMKAKQPENNTDCLVKKRQGKELKVKKLQIVTSLLLYQNQDSFQVVSQSTETVSVLHGIALLQFAGETLRLVTATQHTVSIMQMSSAQC